VAFLLLRLSEILFCLRRNVSSDGAGGIKHVCAHPTRRFISLALRDGVQNGLMFLSRTSKPACVTELRSAKSFHSIADGQGLFRHECVVGRTVNSLVKFAIELIVPIDVAALDQRFRCVMHFDELATLERGHSVGGNPDAHRLDLSRRFEHFHDAFRRHLRNDDAASRSDLDQAGDGKLPERLTDGRSRRAEPVGKVLFVQTHAGRKRAGCNLVGQYISYLIGEELRLLSVNR
jgi:hypothetical protein